MQGQRSAIGSLADSINFDYGSTSNNVGIDQQICWNNFCDPAESRLSDCWITPGDRDGYMGNISQEGRNMSRWSIGESSSSNLQNLINDDERMTLNGWSSSITSVGASPTVEGRQHEPSSATSRNGVNLNLNMNEIASEPSFAQGSNSASMSLSHDSNVGQLEQVGCDFMDCSNSSKPSGLKHRLIPSSGACSEPFASSSGSGGFSVEEDDGRSGCTPDGRRLSCKRKTIEGNVGQSSNSGGCFSREGSMWQAVPPCYNVGSSGLNISSQLETSLGVNTLDSVNSRLELNMAGIAPDVTRTPSMGSGGGSSQRSNRVRINPSRQQDSLPNNSFLPPVTVGHLDVSPGQPLRLVPFNPPMELVPPSDPDNANPHQQPVVLPLPRLHRNMQRLRWNGASRSRAGSSSASLASGERETPLHEDLNSRPIARDASEHPMFIPSVEVRSNSAQRPANWSLNGGSLGMPRHFGSISRAGPGFSSHSTSGPGGPSWGSSRRHPPSQYSRRLSEYIRRSLLSSGGPDIGGHSGSSSANRSVASSSQETVLPSGGGSQGHSQPFSRSAPWRDRHGDGVIGIPYSLRTSSVGGEGRSRLVSEHIRNVLDIMRRGEGLRFEDVMILDPSVFFGMADIHDQHRDMRLDVDNMSYEELLALEERIGNVCTGLSAETIAGRMKQRKYSPVMTDNETEVEPCCICQEEYNDGEDLGTLDCGHDFHSECIKQWLSQKNLCPICKTTALST